MYDVIGDIHGRAEELVRMMIELTLSRGTSVPGLRHCCLALCAPLARVRPPRP